MAADEQETPRAFGPAELEPPKPPSRKGVFFNPVALALGSLAAEAVFGGTGTSALTANATYGMWPRPDQKFTASGLGIGLIDFPRGQLFKGPYFAPSVQFVQTRGGADGAGTVVGLRAVVGYHWDWQPVALKLGGGGEFFTGSLTGDDDNPLAGVWLAIDASIGFTWH